MSRREDTVEFKCRMTLTMRARLERFTAELALPSSSSVVCLALGEFFDRQIALRGEAYVSVPKRAPQALADAPPPKKRRRRAE